MGQQQLLLILLGTVIVGIATAVAISLFKDQAAATNRDEVVNDLAHYATAAQGYYRKPRILGGGGSSFNGLTMEAVTATPSQLNGTYTLDPNPVGGDPAFVTLTGVGTEQGNNGTENVKVVMYVYPDSVLVDETLGN
jgi:type II secretory pathway pseudopilin PulG